MAGQLVMLLVEFFVRPEMIVEDRVRIKENSDVDTREVLLVTWLTREWSKQGPSDGASFSLHRATLQCSRGSER